MKGTDGREGRRGMMKGRRMGGGRECVVGVRGGEKQRFIGGC